MYKSLSDESAGEQALEFEIEDFVANAKRRGMTFDELLSAVMSWALQELHEGKAFSHEKAAALGVLEANLIKEYKIRGSIKGFARSPQSANAK